MAKKVNQSVSENRRNAVAVDTTAQNGALEKSIEHWRSIVTGTDLSAGVSNCPLCAAFRSKVSSTCGVGGGAARFYVSGM